MAQAFSSFQIINTFHAPSLRPPFSMHRAPQLLALLHQAANGREQLLEVAATHANPEARRVVLSSCLPLRAAVSVLETPVS